MTVFGRSFFDRSALAVAPLLLGALLAHETDAGRVVLRLTEVEAYLGPGVDAGSHAFRGPRPRTAAMFGPPGHLYAYFTYGMHTCANVVCDAEGRASAVLLRAAEVVEGVELATFRRGEGVPVRDLARGPARLTVAAGILLGENGADLLATPFSLEPASSYPVFAAGPRVGVAGEAGTDAFPWRFWIPGDPTVSHYRPAVRRKRAVPPARSLAPPPGPV